jgi:kynurenine formamidase
MLRITVVKHWEYRVMHDLLIRLVAWADKSWILRQTWDLFRDIQSCWRVATISFNTTKMLLRTCRSEIAVLIALGLTVTACGANAGGEPTLWNIQKVIASKKYVDLTHDFSPGIPRWPGFPEETRKTIYWYDKRPDTLGSGFFSELFTHVGQWGTHVDPPTHFVKGLRTDWSKRWPDAAKMQNKDAKGLAHYPGWSLPALKYLYEERKITALGHETTDTDPGIATTKDDYSLETYILSTNHYQIELLTNLDQVPEAGATLSS